MHRHSGILDAMLPEGWGARRLRAMLALELTTNEELRKAPAEAVMAGVFACAKMRLEPNTPQGFIYLIPYGGKVEVQLGYQGARHLVLRSGKICKLKAYSVHEGEDFIFERSHDGLHFLHRPSLEGFDAPFGQSGQGGNPSKILACYSIATYTDRNVPDDIELVTGSYLRKVKAHSLGTKKNIADSPWNKWELQMCLKTATKVHAKSLPKPDDVAFGLRLDNQADAGKQDLVAMMREEMQKANAITVHQLRSEINESKTDDAMSDMASAAATKHADGATNGQ